MVRAVTNRTIGNYVIDQFIGYGASSVVFKGFDLKCKAQGVTKPVAIKFIWHRELALDELRRLEKTQSVFEICNLITYDEISGAEARGLIGDTIRNLEKAMKGPLPIQDEKPIGVLILELVKGSHLIDRKIYNNETLDPQREWIIELDDPKLGEKCVIKEWLTQTTQSLSLEQRLDLLTQLTRAIAASHELGVVHGDLNPWNVFYNEETASLSIIDLGRNNFGVHGWRAPEHYRLLTGEIKSLPKRTDVWLLGQWMKYLLPPRGPWARIIGQCCLDDPENRPSAKELHRELQRIRQKKPRRYIFAAVAILAIAASGLYAWRARTPFSLSSSGYNRIAVLPFDGPAVSKTLSDMVRSSLATTEDLSIVRGPNVKSAMAGLKDDRSPESLLKVGNSLGAQFTLQGEVTQRSAGQLDWRGTLIQSNGVYRQLHARGQNQLILADAISTVVLELLGSNNVPLPAADFFSPNVNANFLYIYGNEFLEEGNINAAMPMFEKAVAADENFLWAEAQLAFCYYRGGRFEDSKRILEELIHQPELEANPRLKVTATESLAILSYESQEYEKANQLIEGALSLSQAMEITEFLPRLHSWSSVIKTGMGLTLEAKAAQDRAADSIREGADPVSRINDLMFQAIAAYSESNFDSERDLFTEALELARIHNLDSKEAAVLLNIGILEVNTPPWEIPSRTLDYLNQAREIQIRIGEEYELLQTEYQIAKYYQKINQFKKSMAIAEQVLEKAKKRGHGRVLFSTLMMMGTLNYELKQNDEAELFYLEALSQKPSNMDLKNLYSVIWRVYSERGDYPTAVDYLQKSRELAKSLGDTRSYSYSLNNLGELFEKQGLTEEARTHYEESLQIKRQLQDQNGIVWTLRNMAMLAIKTGELNKANRFMDEVLKIDPQGLQSGLVLARLEYERGNFPRAHDILTSLREEMLEKGRWHQELETRYQLYAKAEKEGRLVNLPEQFGNF